MEQRLPPRAPPLSAARASTLHSCVAGMTTDLWLDTATVQVALQRAEGALCALSGCAGLTQFMQRVTGGGGGGGPCTSVWTSGTIAYRCHTCGLSPSAAICVSCFRESDHEGHDYTMYTSDAGGCCDCGDLSSWRPAGCCPRHRPPGVGQGAAATPALPPSEAAVLHGIIGCVLVRLQLALEGSLQPRVMPGEQVHPELWAARRLVQWLCQLAQAPAVRAVLCEEVLRPAAPSAEPPAPGSCPEDAPGVSAEAAEVARMLRQQRQELLAKLAAVLPVPGAPEGAPAPAGQAAAGQMPHGLRPLPVMGPGPHQHSLLYWQLSTLLALDVGLVEVLATLHILLLYSVPFKAHFGRVLLAFYPHIGALGKRHAVTKALDRVTVQVFHLEETTLELAKHDRLLPVLLGCVLEVLGRGCSAAGELDGDSHALASRQYLRCAADLHMCLSHPAVVLQLLGSGSVSTGGTAGQQEGEELFSRYFLEVFRKIQGASPFRRKLGEHVLYESTAWVNTVQLEVHMMHMLKQGGLHTLMKAAEAGTVPAETVAQALGSALQRCLAAVESAAGPLQRAEEPHAFWATVLSGQGSISAHIPLERLSAAFLSSLLHLASTSPQPDPYLLAAARALGTAEGQGSEEWAAAARRWEMCGVASERVLAWMSQIRQRLWVRNGQQLLRLEAFYSSPYWWDHGMDCDLLSVQAWQASTPTISRALGFFAVDGSGLRLLRASAAASLAEAVALLQDGPQSQDMLRCLADWLRLLVAVLRERSVWHPTYSPLQLRRALVHILAVGPRSHSEVGDELPYELAHSSYFDQVLRDVADYRPPTAAATGRYTLKKECWREFDPFFPHYTRRDLQTALHTAQESGAWQPEWQLAAGLPSVPGPMAGLQRVLHHLLRLIWTSLLLACSGAANGGPAGAGAGGASEDCALAATSLLCLVLQRKQADFAALLAAQAPGSSQQAQAPPAGGQAAAAPPPPLPAAWATPAGFRQKCEEYFAGSPPERPGILFLLRVLAGVEPWVDGSRREGSWELQKCASAAAAQAQHLLATVRRHTEGAAGGPAAEQQQQQGTEQAGAAAGAAGGSPGPSAGPADAAMGEEGGESEAQRKRKQQAKQRQQQMLARMRAQQAKAAAALLEGEGAEGSEGGTPERPASAASAPAQAAEPAAEGAAAMDVDGGGGEQAGEAAAASRAEAAVQAAAALPAHHPAAWEAHGGAECALCHSGGEAAPLGLVAQLQLTELPMMASADTPAPYPADRIYAGLPGGAIGAPSEEEQEEGWDYEVEDSPPPPLPAPFPAPGAGPRLSLFDRQPTPHVLCCGHLLHAACLDRYRSSWRQRIAAGQFVEGFQLLQASSSAAEYLCPICRRLGNCLLPLAPPAQPQPAPPAACGEAEAAGPAVLTSQLGVERLEGLLSDESLWAAAPATSSPQLAQQWQQALAAAPGGPAGLPEGLRLVPQFGCHAEGVAGLCEHARLAATKWILAQQRLLEWLQHRPEESPFMWRIPVVYASQGAGPGGAEPAAGGHSLQQALQELLEHAGGDEGGAAQALEAFVAAAGAMEMEMERVADEEGEEEGSEEEEEGEERVDIAPAMAFLEQLQQQAAAAADDARAEAEQAGGAGGVVAGVPAPAAAGQAAGAAGGGGPVQLHTRRLWGAKAPGSTLWSLLGSGVVQWEVAHRDPAAAPAAEVDAAHWRALQSLVQLALASQPDTAGAAGQDTALHLLQQLAAGKQLAAPVLPYGPADVTAALPPTLTQLQLAPVFLGYPSQQDPWVLLLRLLAALLAREPPTSAGSEPGLACMAHRSPAAVLDALLAVMYPAVAGQAARQAAQASSPSGYGGRQDQEVLAAIAAGQAAPAPVATALESAVGLQLLPWLQRAAVLAALLSGGPPPPSPAGGAGLTGGTALVTVLQRLRLPPLAAALREPAAAGLPPVPAEVFGRPVPGQPNEMRIRSPPGQWDVSLAPQPAAPQLMQLPASFQAWYLGIGKRLCSVCGNLPAEPALCLRCGEVMCCGGRRCHGPAQQGMCYTHSLACGGGTACFLLLKMTRLLVIRKNRATFLPSPFVDSHGEEDIRLQRGKPLSLHAERLRRLVQLWRGGAWDFDSSVLHAANHRNEMASIY